jgi:hypothetical protein
MITVWCVCNGDKYTHEDVYILRRQVARHLKHGHDFWCLSDKEIPGVDCIIPHEKRPGWWAKTQLFRYAKSGRNLYLDLDCVVVGDLYGLLSERLSMPANWAQSGHGGCQSSVMSWGLDYSFIADDWECGQLHKAENGNCGAYGARRLWGDQEYITSILGNPGGGTIEPMQGVYSYKYHCHAGHPTDARVVAFHGLPKPGDVGDAWVKSARFM